MNLDVSRCDRNETQCASEDEIDDFIIKNRLVFFFNNAKYNREDYGDQMIEKFYTLNNYAFEQRGRNVAKSYKIKKVEVTHTDSLLIDLFSKTKKFYALDEFVE